MENNVNNNTPLESINNKSFLEKLFIHRKVFSLFIGLLVTLPLLIGLFALIPSIFKNPVINQKVTIKYWGIADDLNVYTTIIDDFKKEHPNIDVIYESQNAKVAGKYTERLLNHIQADSGPDIFMFHNSWTKQIKGALLVLPSDVVLDSELESKYFSVVKKDLKLDGAYYGIPLEIDTLALFINKEIFNASGISTYPSTWNDVVNLGKQLTVLDENKKIKTSGIALGTYDNISHASDIISLLLVQNGANLNDLTKNEVKKNAEDAFDYYISFTKGDSRVWDETLPNSKLAFANGNLAMFFGYSYDIEEIRRLNPKLNFVVISSPHIPGGSGSDARNSTIASYWVNGVSIKSKHPKEAFMFLNYLSRKDVMQKINSLQIKSKGYGDPYPREDMISLLDFDPNISIFAKQASNAVSTPFSSNTYDNLTTEILNGYLKESVRSILNGSLPTQAVIQTLSREVNQVLSKYR